MSGKWKIILGMSMQFTWPFARGLAVAAAYIWPSWSRMLQVGEVRSGSLSDCGNTSGGVSPLPAGPGPPLLPP